MKGNVTPFWMVFHLGSDMLSGYKPPQSLVS